MYAQILILEQCVLTFSSQRQIYGRRLAGELEAGLKWWPVGVSVQFKVISVWGEKRVIGAAEQGSVTASFVGCCGKVQFHK